MRMNHFATVSGSFNFQSMLHRVCTILIGSAFLMCQPQSVLADIELTPNDIGGGNIPALAEDIQFRMFDGNYSRVVTLPDSATDGLNITVSSNATFSASIDNKNINTLFTLGMVTGDRLSFRYQSSTQKWRITGMPVDNFVAGDFASSAPDLSGRYSRLTYSNGNWNSTVPLPRSAPDNAQFVIASNADQPAIIETDLLRYNSSSTLAKGDRYLLTFDGASRKWLISRSPVRNLNADQVRSGIPVPTYQLTRVQLFDSNRIDELTLPSTAKNRDRIIIGSSSTQTSSISNRNTSFTGTMILQRGDQYEFLFDSDLQTWALTDYPVRRYPANRFGGGRLPDMTAPEVKISTWNGNWTERLVLPAKAKPGDKVSVTNSDARGIYVIADKAEFDAPLSLRRGESRRFVYSTTGNWKLDTVIVSVLWLYSQQAADQLGGNAAMKTRIFESFRLGQEALANSGANFTIKLAKIAQWTPPNSESLGDVLRIVRTDPQAQGLREEVKADAVYYTGTETGCGLAWVNGITAFNMAGSENIGCGTTVFRHEFGHMMGLGHAGSGGRTAYAQGYGPARTVMGGNAIPYFSNTTLYVPGTWQEMGIVNEADGVRAMNEVSNDVANFRN